MKGLKKMLSRQRLPSNRQEVVSGRNITPPNQPDPLDAFTTPPLQSTSIEPDVTPVEAVLGTPKTPSSDPNVSSVRSKLKRLLKKPDSPITKPLPVKPAFRPSLIEQGITGADFSLPILDGLSDNPKDYLIDFEDESSEKIPDIRVYYWTIGDEVLRFGQRNERPPEHDRPTDPAGIISYDDRLVKMGRQHLLESQAKGQGYYISPHRQLLANNHPGDPYYRLPAVGLAWQIQHGEIDAIECEGTLYEYKDEEEWQIGETIKTNIRIPMVWAEAIKEGIVPGMNGWDATFRTVFRRGQNPVYNAVNNHDRRDMVIDLMSNCAGNTPDWPCDPTVIDRIIDEVWPDINEDSEDEDERDERDRPNLFKLQGITMDNFLGAKKKGK